MARSMGGGRSGGGRSGGSRGGGRSGRSSSGGGRSSSSRSMGSSRSGSSRSFGSGRSGGSSMRGAGRSYSGGSSYGNPGMGHRPSSSSHYGHHGHHHHTPHHHHYHRPYHNHYYGGGRTYYRRSSGAGCSSCLSTIIVMIILFAVLSSFASVARNGGFKNYNDNYSTVEREKFEGEVHLNGYYSDPDFLLYDDEIKPIEDGLKHFYQKTGVAAHVYLVEELEPGVDGVAKAEELYEELFDDEGHILLLYDYMNAEMFDACGYEIGTTIDSEAIDIIYDYVEAKWSRDSENLGAIFGEGLSDAADRIMYKDRSFGEKYKGIIITVIICIVLIIVVNVLYKWWKAKKAQDNKEQADLERTLNTPLQTFGSDINDLAKKYDDPNNNSNNTPNNNVTQ